MLRFGVFPLGVAGAPGGLAAGPADDFDAIGRTVADLAGDQPLLIRMYVAWAGEGSTDDVMGQVAAMAGMDEPVDLVLCYRDPAGDLDGWARFCGRVMVEHGSALSALQITGEPNLTGIPHAADGAFPRAREAMVAGILAARSAKDRTGATADLGFAVVPDIDPAAGAFWPGLADTGIADAVDYAGLDCYPDVFGPRIAVADLDGSVDWLLRSFRETALPLAGIGPDTPIRIWENGWPTGEDRPEDRQADVLEAVIRGIDRRSEELGVTHYELFTLRDADSRGPTLFHHFGILRDDYTPKPAFGRLQGLIAELGH